MLPLIFHVSVTKVQVVDQHLQQGYDGHYLDKFEHGEDCPGGIFYEAGEKEQARSANTREMRPAALIPKDFSLPLHIALACRCGVSKSRI